MEVFIICWATHGSRVDEWDYDELNQIETRGRGVKEAMRCVADGMLCADGLGKNEGIFGKAFPTVELAQGGLRECYDTQVANMRHAIKECIGIDEEAYQESLDLVEIAEVPSAKLISGGAVTHLDMRIHWGTTGYTYEGNWRQHEHMPCCVCVSTHMTCWIETLEMVEPESVTESTSG